MKLFEEIDLFDEGEKRFVEFRLPGAQLELRQQFFTKPDSDLYFKLLQQTTPWQQGIRKMYDKLVADPRLTAYYGGPNGHEWTPSILLIEGED